MAKTKNVWFQFRIRICRDKILEDYFAKLIKSIYVESLLFLKLLCKYELEYDTNQSMSPRGQDTTTQVH